MPKKHTQSNKVRKRKAKDLDQIHEDLIPEKAAKLMNQPIDYDVTGDAQHYCIECSRYFDNALTLGKHKKSKGKCNLYYYLLFLVVIYLHIYFQCTKLK